VKRLETDRLTLRPCTEDDLASFGLVHPNPERELDDGLAHWREYGFGPWTLIDRASGEFVGVLELHYAGEGLERTAPDEFEIGWVLHESHRGRGLATEAAEAVLDHAFRHLGTPWIVAYIHPENAASLRVAEKLGMESEGLGQARAGPMMLYRLYGEGPATRTGPSIHEP